MTHLCYTLEEAAGKLNLSETVLVRLSQYFKIPKTAYEDVGYLSFKGDLVFSDQDIAFFRQVKERLLAGESLDEVKSRIREDEVVTVPARSAQAGKAPVFSELIEPAAQPKVRQPQSRQAPVAMAVVPPMQVIADRIPYEQAAEKSFERYKSMHRSGLVKVFENMLKEVGSATRKKSARPNFKPLRNKVTEPQPEDSFRDDQAQRPDAILPFKSLRQPVAETPTTEFIWDDVQEEAPTLSGVKPNGRWPQKPAGPAEEAAWEAVIRQAAHQPRTLDSHLKNAAALLRDRAIGQSSRTESRSR